MKRTQTSPVRLNIYLPDQATRRRIKLIAAEQNLTLSHFCLQAIQAQLTQTDNEKQRTLLKQGRGSGTEIPTTGLRWSGFSGQFGRSNSPGPKVGKPNGKKRGHRCQFGSHVGRPGNYSDQALLLAETWSKEETPLLAPCLLLTEVTNALYKRIIRKEMDLPKIPRGAGRDTGLRNRDS